MKEIQLEQVDQSIQKTLPPGHKFESMFTTADLSYTVKVCFVDLQDVIQGINHSYSKSDTLIKYSETIHSPVSSEPADCIRLGTPSCFRESETETNSELIADDFEGRYIESLNSKTKGSIAIETIKKKLRTVSPYLINNISVKITLARNDFLMYCTSIAPHTNYMRKKQIKTLPENYNFMTKIEDTSEFAKQLGREVGKYFNFHNNLKCDLPGLHLITSALKKQDAVIGEHLIFVNHGPVIYLNEDKIVELMNSVPEGDSGNYIPFVKRKKYEDQQEYRFIVDFQLHSPNKDYFDLQISDGLRNLMAPIGVFRC